MTQDKWYHKTHFQLAALKPCSGSEGSGSRVQGIPCRGERLGGGLLAGTMEGWALEQSIRITLRRDNHLAQEHRRQQALIYIYIYRYIDIYISIYISIKAKS